MLGVLAVAYVVGYFLTGDRVPSGTTVSGVGIGGLSAEAAEEKLDEQLAEQSSAPIVLRYEGERFRVVPADVGLALDSEETVLDAGATMPLEAISLVVLREWIEPELVVDDAVAASLATAAIDTVSPSSASGAL